MTEDQKLEALRQALAEGKLTSPVLVEMPARGIAVHFVPPRRTVVVPNELEGLPVRQTPPRRWSRLAPVLALLGCLACPAHLALLPAFFGLGLRGATAAEHREPWWLLGLLVVGLAVPLAEVLFHRHHQCSHRKS